MRLDLTGIRGTTTAELSRSMLAEWRVGAILQAVAVRGVKSGELWLNIGQQCYPARLASGDGNGPADGETLTLRVLRNSPVLALETLRSEPAGRQTDEGVAADGLRRYVPRQTSPTPLVSNLSWLMRSSSGSDALPAPVMQAATRLWQAMPDTTELTDPTGLRNAIARSGTFLEATLASGNARAAAPQVAVDLKALMLDLARVLREHGARPAAAIANSSELAPMPGARGPLASLPTAPATLAIIDNPSQQMHELARQTDGALSRLTTAQISNTAQDSSLPSMLLEIPVRLDDRASMLRLRIEKDGANKPQAGAAAWTVEAALDLGSIGALHARVTLSGQRIGVQLRAESASVVEALALRAPELEAMLRDAGLEVDRVVCLHGMPAGETGTRLTRLLDVRA